MTEPRNMRLFSKAQVSLATFLGLPIAGAILISRNAKAMGNPGGGRQSVAAGAVWTVITLAVVLLLPVPALFLSIANILAVRQWYKQTQEAAFDDYIAQGGERASWAAPIFVGVVVLILIGVLAAFGAIMLGTFAWRTGDG